MPAAACRPCARSPRGNAKAVAAGLRAADDIETVLDRVDAVDLRRDLSRAPSRSPRYPKGSPCHSPPLRRHCAASPARVRATHPARALCWIGLRRFSRRDSRGGFRVLADGRKLRLLATAAARPIIATAIAFPA